MIRFEDVTITYDGATRPALAHVDLDVPEGELALVVGRTGSGKSTLLRAVNGLVPHFTGGHLEGHVCVAGLDTRDRPPRDVAHLVGYVGQDPLAGFVTDTVEEELAYGMEQLAVPAAVMRKRVEETLDLLGIADLRRRPLTTLSGGQQQRVAIGSVLTTDPRVLVLDEPTSALDPTAAEDVLAAITRLVHDLGVTVLMAEHRMERVLQYADRLLLVDGATVRQGTPEQLLVDSPVAPPVVELGRIAGWDPLPLSVRDARRRATHLRFELAATPAYAGPPAPASATGPPVLTSSAVVVRHGQVVAVRGVDLDLRAGEVVALMGRNGSGKSSLLWALQGSGPRHTGRVDVAGQDPAAVSPAQGPRAGRSGPADRRRPALPGDRRRGVRGRRPRVAGAARHLPWAARPHRARRRRRPAPARPVRGPAALAGAGGAAHRRAAGRAARRADPGPGLPRQGRARGHRRRAGRDGGRPSWSRPTTWSSSPGWRPGWWSWPRARWSPTGRPSRSWRPRRSSRRRSPRCWGRPG